MDQEPNMQREEEEEDNLNESAGRRTEEEEPVDRREEEEKKGSEEPATDQRKAAADAEEKERSSEEEEPMEEEEAASLSLHPCSLLQYVVRAFASRLGISDPFGGTKPSGESAPLGPSAEGQDADEKNPPSTANGFYMQGVITTSVWAVRRARPRPPGNPVEGSGGNGGHHH